MRSTRVESPCVEPQELPVDIADRGTPAVPAVADVVQHARRVVAEARGGDIHRVINKQTGKEAAFERAN